MKRNYIQKFVFRADADAKIGYGHLMRCLALAEELKNTGVQSTFVISNPSESIIKRVQTGGFEVINLKAIPGSPEDALETARIAKENGSFWVSVDGYKFNSQFQKILKDSGLRVFFMDDYGHCDHYYAEIVLNQNISADKAFYKSREDCTELLLGTDYVLIRQEFKKCRQFKKGIRHIADRILITIGGSDPYNVTLKVMQAFEKLSIKDLKLKVVVGGANPNISQIYDAVKTFETETEILKDISNMSELMEWADIIVSGGGSTCWEMALLGLPGVIIAWADNQRPIAEKLGAVNAALNLGWHENIDYDGLPQVLNDMILAHDNRQSMSDICRSIIDGYSTERVITKIYQHSLSIKPAESKDCELLWNWVNEEGVRKNSYSSEPVSFENHSKWFEGSLKNENRLIFIISDFKGIPLGQIRFDIQGTDAEIDLSVDKNYRGFGLASHIICKGALELMKRRTNLLVLHAFIKKENSASSASFRKAGFAEAGTEIKNGFESTHMVLKINDKYNKDK